MPAAHAFALGAAARVAFPRASRRPRTPARASSSDDASPPPPPARKGNPGELRLLGDSDLMVGAE